MITVSRVLLIITGNQELALGNHRKNMARSLNQCLKILARMYSGSHTDHWRLHGEPIVSTRLQPGPTAGGEFRETVVEHFAFVRWNLHAEGIPRFARHENPTLYRKQKASIAPRDYGML